MKALEATIYCGAVAAIGCIMGYWEGLGIFNKNRLGLVVLYFIFGAIFMRLGYLTKKESMKK